nr:hypothetical protein [uncultured Draconibacterium sp.]
MKTLIYILTMTCFFHQTYCFGESLNRNIDNQPQIDIDSEEIEIINLTFLALIGTQWYYEPLLPPPMPLADDATKEDSIKYQDELRIINQKNENRKLDTSRLIVFFKDSLIAYPTSERQTDILEPKNFASNFPVDISYIFLIKKLYSQAISKSIDLRKITEIGKYKILPVSEIETLEGNYKKIGVVRYSRIVFNENRDKACFYFDFLHGPLLGFGQIVFIEKNQGKWTIIGQREMWVA